MGGGFIQWHMAVIWFWCALFVASQFDVIFLFQDRTQTITQIPTKS